MSKSVSLGTRTVGGPPSGGSLFRTKTVMDARPKEHEFLITQAASHTESIKIGRED
jgi:hypothetical protein